MASQNMIRLTIAFTDSAMVADEQEAEAINLLLQLRDLEAVERVERVAQPTPEGGKGLGFLPGWLMAEVSVANGKKLLAFLGSRLAGKSIEMEVESNGRSLKVKAGNLEELKQVIAAAEQFIEG